MISAIWIEYTLSVYSFLLNTGFFCGTSEKSTSPFSFLYTSEHSLLPFFDISYSASMFLQVSLFLHSRIHPFSFSL